MSNVTVNVSVFFSKNVFRDLWKVFGCIMTIFNYAILDMATFNNPSISEGSSPHNQQNGISPSYFLLALLPSFCGSFEKEYCYYYGICFQFISFVDLRNFLIFCYGYSFCRKKNYLSLWKENRGAVKKRF